MTILAVLTILTTLVYLHTYKHKSIQTVIMTDELADHVPRYLKALNETQRLSHPLLPSALPSEAYKKYMELMNDLVELLGQRGVRASMVDGTLLGSYMVHDILPWDDDLDVILNYNDRFTVFELFSQPEIRKIYEVRSYHAHSDVDWFALDKLQNWRQIEVKEDFKFKFYRTDSPKAGNYEWGWPYIDVKYYNVEGNYVKKMDRTCNEHPWPTDHVFPLKPRPFGNLWLLSPANTRAVLRLKYKKFLCEASTWNHIKEERRQKISVSCSELLDYYPCVNRTWAKAGEGWEALVLHGKPIYNIQVNEPHSNTTGCYEL